PTLLHYTHRPLRHLSSFPTRRSSDLNQGFLFQLYASTRIHEIAPFGWSPPQQEAFLRVQFNAQQGWYQQAYPQADHQIIFAEDQDRKSTRLNSSHVKISYAVFCLKKK